MPDNMKNMKTVRNYITIYEENSSSSYNCKLELMLCYGYKLQMVSTPLYYVQTYCALKLSTDSNWKQFLCLFREYCIFYPTIYNIQVTSLWSSIQRLATIVEKKLLFSSFKWYFVSWFEVQFSLLNKIKYLSVQWFNYIWNVLRNSFKIRIMNMAHWTQATTLNECVVVYNVHRSYDIAYCVIIPKSARGKSARNSRWGFNAFHLLLLLKWGLMNEKWRMENGESKILSYYLVFPYFVWNSVDVVFGFIWFLKVFIFSFSFCSPFFSCFSLLNVAFCCRLYNINLYVCTCRCCSITIDPMNAKQVCKTFFFRSVQFYLLMPFLAGVLIEAKTIIRCIIVCENVKKSASNRSGTGIHLWNMIRMKKNRKIIIRRWTKAICHLWTILP